MITFKDALPKLENATIVIGDKLLKAQYERDAEGNLVVSADFEEEPDHGTPIFLTLITENNSEYHGQILHMTDGQLVYAPL